MSVDFLSKNFPPFQVHHAKKPPRFYPDGFQRNVIDFYFIFSDCRLRKALYLQFSYFIWPLCERKTNRRKAVVSIVTLCLTLVLCLIGIYAVGDNEKQLPDGLSAVENSIAEINVYSEGEERSISIDSYQYRSFASQISNCGGHLLEIQKTSEGEIWNDTDCFIEIIYTADQTIKFENAENFSIECADRLLYNADKNVLYWGEAGYQNCLDYTKMNEEMQAHKEEILKGYEELSTSIRDCFNQ